MNAAYLNYSSRSAAGGVAATQSFTVELGFALSAAQHTSVCLKCDHLMSYLGRCRQA